MLRCWASLSPDKYGEVVASKKNKLADELAHLFNQPNLRTAIRKTFRDSQGNIGGDVDLAILEELSGCLIFIEVKWIIEPDSFQEESNALEDIDKGIEQLATIENQVTLNREQFITGVFDQKIRVDKITDVYYLLVSRGSVESHKNTKYDILDYELSSDLLKKSIGLPLKARIQELIDAHKKLRTKAQAELRYSGIKIAGYLMQIPSVSSTRIGQDKSIGKKSECFCGSGKAIQKLLSNY